MVLPQSLFLNFRIAKVQMVELLYGRHSKRGSLVCGEAIALPMCPSILKSLFYNLFFVLLGTPRNGESSYCYGNDLFFLLKKIEDIFLASIYSQEAHWSTERDLNP